MAAIVLGYVALVWQAGAWGALAVAVHVGIMLAGIMLTAGGR